MLELLFTHLADAQLSQLQTDPDRNQLYERVNDVLDAIEDDPNSHVVRQRRYQIPPIWGVPVFGSGEAWLILWSETKVGPLIHYIGEDLQ